MLVGGRWNPPLQKMTPGKSIFPCRLPTKAREIGKKQR